MTMYADPNDVDAIVEAGRTNYDEVKHLVPNLTTTSFTWDYERSRVALGKLYEKAKTAQWNVSTDLDWATPVDYEGLAEQALQAPRDRQMAALSEPGGPLASWGDAEWKKFLMMGQTNMLSQFLHGEQGALLVTAKLVECVPWIDAKYYAATQVMDEARHVEVFGRYLDEKLEGSFPINPHLRSLLDDIIKDERWDICYLGMQVMVEGLALAAFGFMHATVDEPLLKTLLRYVMSDEARHVAFGVLSLQELYREMSAADIRERQEFAYEAAVRLRNRWFQTDVWERMDVDPRLVVKQMVEEPTAEEQQFQALLFSKIVPNCKKLGLLDAGDAWLRTKFTELGIIGFEDWVDTSVEYEELQATGQTA
jgi:hypothetical protein